MKNKTYSIVFCAIGVALNIVLSFISSHLKISFVFFDVIGTVLSAAVLGPLYGAITGFVTNLITSMINNPAELPYALVNMIIGIVVGIISINFGFKIHVAIITGLILAVVAPLVGTPITVLLYGGLAGGTMDIMTGFLVQSGQKIFTAAFIPRIISNIIDKPLSCIIASIIILRIPTSLLNKITSNKKILSQKMSKVEEDI